MQLKRKCRQPFDAKCSGESVKKNLKRLICGWILLSGTGCYHWRQEASQDPLTPLRVASPFATRHLLYATETSVDIFLQRMLRQKPRKARGIGNWFVLEQDEAFLYYGYPVWQHLLSEERVVQTLYKVSRYQVERCLPQVQFRDFEILGNSQEVAADCQSRMLN